MVSRTKIRDDIEQTREHISFTIDEISHVIHKKFDVQEKIKEHPLESLAIAMALGFTMASFASPIGKAIFRIGLKSATATVGAFATKKGIEIITNKIKA
ncbi:MAG: hypothetical protein PHC34_03010 [Candidatus Gastranaerophilales bacterium]|nr:hypothetical protein [Candidatus Gastranaerophilales bacterium]